MASQRAFPLNAWYAIAWDAELRHELLPRTVANKKIVLYRRSDGQPVALEDACWHRLLPLSKGRLKGDEVVCGYHGLIYDEYGRCTLEQDRLPAAELAEELGRRLAAPWTSPKLSSPRGR